MERLCRYRGSEKADLKPDTNSENSLENPLADHSGEELLRFWKAGDQRAADILVDRYSLRLIALVASRMNRRFRGSMDPEDVVQSALGSFFIAARQSRIQISGSVSLWRLLATFARRKIARSVERLDAAKREAGINAYHWRWPNRPGPTNPAGITKSQSAIWLSRWNPSSHNRSEICWLDFWEA